VTVGDAELTVGVDEALAPLADEELAFDEDATDEPPLTTVGVVVEAEPEGTVAVVPVFLPVLPDPAWSWDTPTPMATVAPVAARTTPRVRLRSRARALSRLSGVWG
jgi:hypothetical protein